ncbi:MAG: hypothetical protein ABEH90_01940 [Halolamina sp.]
MPTTTTLEHRISRIVAYQTSPEQPDRVPARRIMLHACAHGSVPYDEFSDELRAALDAGEIEEVEYGLYRVAES